MAGGVLPFFSRDLEGDDRRRPMASSNEVPPQVPP